MPIRMQAIGTEFSSYLRMWSRDLAGLRQNDLLGESAFLSIAREIDGFVHADADQIALGAKPSAN